MRPFRIPEHRLPPRPHRRSSSSPRRPNTPPPRGARRARRTAAAGVILSLALSLGGCAAGHTAVPMGNAPAEDTVRVGTTTAMMSMDFTRDSGAAIPQALMGNVYETLVTIDDDGHLAPNLASSWDVSPDELTYTFHLRPGVTFSDGSPFTSQTAEFSLRRARDEWINTSARQLDVIADMDTPDPLTLTITLSHRSTQWLWRMTTFVGAMMAPQGINRIGTDPLGTGPYQVAFFSPGTGIHFRARDDYWGTAPDYKEASIQFFTDAISATNALSTGDLDVIWGHTNPEMLDNLDPSLAINVGTSNGEFLLSMNNQRAPFNDERVRQAVSYAVDRRAVLETAWEGYGTDTGGTPVAPTDPWYDPREHYPHNPEKARALLREAGFGTEGNPGPAVTISVPSLPYAQSASEVIYSQLKDVGFQVTLKKTEFPAVWLSEVHKQHDYDMSLIAHVEPRDISRIFGDPSYYLGVDDPELQSLFDQADRGTANEEVPTMRRAVDRIMDHAYGLTLMNVPNIVLSRPGVAGIHPTITTDSLQLFRMTRENNEVS